jgi:hypothetical protein
MLAAAGNYAMYVVKQRTDVQYVKHGATFYGPAEPWRDWVKPSTEKVETTAKASAKGWECPSCHALNTHSGQICMSCHEGKEGA